MPAPRQPPSLVEVIMHQHPLLRVLHLAWLLALALPASAGITWPSSQILPSFPAPAATQDLIQLHGATQQWQVEGPGIGHNTGRLETDGWLCQTGIDPAAKIKLGSIGGTPIADSITLSSDRRQAFSKSSSSRIINALFFSRFCSCSVRLWSCPTLLPIWSPTRA